jgi:single-strand DNA-binding protein
MNESYVTLQGWVGNDVDVRDVGETSCASFRVGSTPRWRKGDSWVDGQTSWFTVNCWREGFRSARHSRLTLKSRSERTRTR